MRFVDPHVHWWDRSNPRFVTATQEQADAFGMGDVSGMDRDYGRDEYLADVASAAATGRPGGAASPDGPAAGRPGGAASSDGPAVEAEKVVWVTATLDFGGQVGEVEWIDRTTAGDPLLAAIIGGIDPTLPVAEWRAAFDAQARAERFRGIRILAGLDHA